MSQLFGILLAMMQIARALIIGFLAYAYLIRPGFMAGSFSAPYWLLRFYNWGSPQILFFTIIFILVVWPFNWLGGLFRFNMPSEIQPLKRILLINVVLGIFAALPTMTIYTEHMTMEQLGDDNFYLIRQESGSLASYGVFRCNDPAGFSCRNIDWSPAVPAPLPTPTVMPETVVDVNGQSVIIAPPFIPTATPSAELILDTTGSAISLKVGTQRLHITSTVNTIDPTPIP